MEIKITNNKNNYQFPKYTSQLINWANQNAQGTRPKTVGQLSELFPEFVKSSSDITIDNWEKWYTEHYPNAIDNAADKIWHHVQLLQDAIKLIDRDMVYQWVNNLIINKTFNGLFVQKDILEYLAQEQHKTFRLATPEEESKGIDGFVGDTPYSIKPISYKTMNRLPEQINVKMVYYEKTSLGLKLDIE